VERSGGRLGRSFRPGIGKPDGAVVVPDRGFDGAALLVPVRRPSRSTRLRVRSLNAGVSVRGCTLVGGHARRYMVSADARPAPAGR